jgi:hypothetical protein
MNDRFRRWQARDRRIAAIHEAGHTVVAWRESVVVEPRIWPRPADEDSAGKMLWLGEIEYAPRVPTPRNMPRARIGVAGVCAEERWLSDHPDGGRIDITSPLNRMSADDWLTAVCPSHQADWRVWRAITQVRALFRQPEVWGDVLAVARDLIEWAPDSPYEGEVSVARERFEALLAEVLAELPIVSVEANSRNRPLDGC